MGSLLGKELCKISSKYCPNPNINNGLEPSVSLPTRQETQYTIENFQVEQRLTANPIMALLLLT